MSNNKWIEEKLRDKNVALIGFADLSTIDAELRYGYKYGVSIAITKKYMDSQVSKNKKSSMSPHS